MMEKFKIYLDDIVVIGEFAGDTSLVCTKMTISEKDYNNAIKKDKLCV